MTFVFLMGDFFFFFNQRFLLVNFFFLQWGFGRKGTTKTLHFCSFARRITRRTARFASFVFFFLFVPKSSRNNLCFRSRATLCARAHTHTFTLFQSHRLHVKLCVSRFLLLFFSLFHFVRHDQIEGKEDVKEKFDLLIRFLTDGWRDI